jgi:hypothetical protein
VASASRSSGLHDLLVSIERTKGALSGLDAGLLAALRGAKSLAFAASGSTALGIETALAELPASKAPCFRSPADYEGAAAARGGPREGRRPELVVGLSMSGRSAEVLEVLRLAARDGARTLLFSASGVRGVDSPIPLGFEGIPRRFLPLAACLFAEEIAGSGAPDRLAAALKTGPADRRPGLAGFVEGAWRSGLAPIFIGSGEGLEARLLAAQYMEFLKKAAFFASFPEWTHDLLWTLGPADAKRFAFVHFAPDQDLPDGRFAKATERLESLGISQLVLYPARDPVDRGPAGAALARALLLFSEVAERLGVDSEAELSFAAGASAEKEEG